MQQITGALVGIALVLAAVFVPMAFFGGSVGVIYRQFSITIVSAMALSVLVALSFTPALCASILKKPKEGPRRGFYGLFNRGYAATNRAYVRGVTGVVRRKWYAMFAFVAIGGALALLFPRMPKGFLPEEDQGVLNAQILLPPGATQEQTRAVMDKVQTYFLENEKESVDQVMAITGFGFGGRGQNTGLAFVRLRDWDERKDERLRAKAVAARAMKAFSQIKEATAFTFAPPAIQELGRVGGFSFEIEDRAGLGREALLAARDQLVAAAAKHPKLARVRPAGLEDRPEYKIEVDREKASALGLSLADINNTLSATWGGAYVNDFIDDGRTKRVYMQADAQFRMSPSDLNRWYVRNRSGEMVPFSAFASGKWTFGAPKLDRFNGFPSVELNGEAGEGASSGEAILAMEELAQQLPPGIGYEWSGLSYDEKTSGANAPILYALSLLVVFLCLAALYESWSIPVSVMLVVPLGVIGAVGATLLAKHANDVYFQVGLLATIGLSAKNAILIVEFAKELVAQGKTPSEAVIEAARMRLRPILMTSLAFILGVLPLALANGAGAGAQNAIGVAVIGGVVAATVLGVLFVPVFFTVISRRPRPPAVAAALIALCSCSLAPKYERPAAPIANQWAVTSQQSAAELGWHDVMRDPRLQAVVELALKNNRDLRVAALNVELVRAQYRIARADLFPTLSGIASAEVAGNKDDAQATYTLGGSLSYELDLFGKLRNQRTAAYEAYLASAEAARAAHIALVGEVATQFLVSQAFDEQLALAKQTLALVQESADVTKRLAEQGQRSDLDLRTAEAQIHAARAEVARVTRLRAQASNALLLLTGVPALPQLPAAAPLETTNLLADLPPGVPSQVLLRRPDVLAAEHALKAANANIGVARAAFFPSISLTAFAGVASTALSSLFTAGAFVWNAGGTLAQPLFTGGKLSATLDVAQVRKQIEVARYELSIQTAFREVADALAAKSALDEQLAAQLARVEAEQKRFAISEQRYKAGIESYIVMITAQRDLFAAQQGLIDVRLQRATNLVELYRALGGGWR
jgi:NodT family efflux transporter outer membrane factor (OMF) lipoprotein